jgi:methylthioribulose-1-phosphate dehydratase
VSNFPQQAQVLVEAGKELYRLGMVPATSGNFSARLDDGNIAITVSGRHKGRLTIDDIMLIDANGKPLDDRRPSAETLLHVQIYRRFPEINVVLHPHSVNATLLSRLQKAHLKLQDYELLKAFPGIDSHDCLVTVPVFANDQNIERLSAKVDDYMQQADVVHGYLIAGHGFYTWGNSAEDVMRHVEAFEFLFDCELRLWRATS